MHQISQEHLGTFFDRLNLTFTSVAHQGFNSDPTFERCSLLLRVTLQKLEHGLDAIHDASAMAELKRMVLLRIAELEAVGALQHAVVETGEVLWFTATPSRGSRSTR
jgi:hypothetical protein